MTTEIWQTPFAQVIEVAKSFPCKKSSKAASKLNYESPMCLANILTGREEKSGEFEFYFPINNKNKSKKLQ